MKEHTKKAKLSSREETKKDPPSRTSRLAAIGTTNGGLSAPGLEGNRGTGDNTFVYAKRVFVYLHG